MRTQCLLCYGARGCRSSWCSVRGCWFCLRWSHLGEEGSTNDDEFERCFRLELTHLDCNIGYGLVGIYEMVGGKNKIINYHCRRIMRYLFNNYLIIIYICADCCSLKCLIL